MKFALNILLAIALSQPFSIMSQVSNNDTIPNQKLGEVVVKADKPQLKVENGTLIVDLPSIIKDKPVNNVLQALGYLPGAVSNNGKIGLAGASNVTITINGELSNMPLQNLYQLLYTMPTDKIKNVEVMYTAPASYHVSGAVVNVNLKTPRALDGLMGQARVGYNQGHYGSFGGALSMMYATKQWAFDFNYSMSKSKGWTHEDVNSNHLSGNQIHNITEDSRRTSKNLTNTIYASATYKFKDKGNIRLIYNGQIISDNKVSNITDGNTGLYQNDYNHDTPTIYHSLTAIYKSNSGLRVGGDYSFYKDDRNQILYEESNRAVKSQTNNYQDINRYHLFVDNVHDFNKWKFSYGVEYKYANDYSRQTYIKPTEQGFDGTVNEHTADAYVGIQHSFNRGFSFNASAKAEYYKIETENNWNFIPQLGITYFKTPKNIFQLNFTSQRVYPSYWTLRGGVSMINDYTVYKGNPSLLPYMNYSTQLSYIYKQKYVATLYYRYADKYYTTIGYQSPEELQLIYQPKNVNFNQTAGLNLHIPFNVKTIFQSTLMANTYYTHLKADHFYDLSFNREKVTFYGALNNTLKFSKNSPISMIIEAAYISPLIQGLADVSSMWKMNVGIKWTFAHNNAELSLRADDIFNTWSPTLTTKYKGQDLKMKTYDREQNVKMTFIWRFNWFKPKKDENGVDTSRYGTEDY